MAVCSTMAIRLSNMTMQAAWVEEHGQMPAMQATGLRTAWLYEWQSYELL